MLAVMDDPRIILSSKWSSIKIGKRGKEYIGVDNCFLIQEELKNNTAIDYYESLYKDTNDKEYSLLRAILSQKNVRLITFKGANEIISLSSDYGDLYRSSKININLPTLKNKDEIIKCTITNFLVSRDYFLDTNIKKNDNIYNYIFKNGNTRYYTKKDNNIIFGLSKDDFLKDNVFTINSIKAIMNNQNTSCLYNEVENKDSYNIQLYLDDCVIKVENIDIYLLSAIIREIDLHNEKLLKNKLLVLKKEEK